MNREIVESFAEMARQKGMDKDVLAGIIEDIFGLLVKKKYGEEARYDVVVNMDRGDIEIYLEREIVETVEDPATQISIEEVNRKGNEDELEVGEDYVEKIELVSLGRRLITLAKQSLNQKIREIEKDIVYNEYKELLGEIVVGDIYQIRRSDILVNHNKNELLLNVLMMRWNVVIGGQEIAKSTRGLLTYQMPLWGWESAVTATLLTLAPFALLAVLVRLFPPWADPPPTT